MSSLIADPGVGLQLEQLQLYFTVNPNLSAEGQYAE